MLATLNLQLGSADLSENLPASMMPADEGKPAFNELLQRNVSAGDDLGGELLPESGNELPSTSIVFPRLEASESSLISNGEGISEQTNTEMEKPLIDRLVDISELPDEMAVAALQAVSIEPKTPIVADSSKLMAPLRVDNLAQQPVTPSTELIKSMAPGVLGTNQLSQRSEAATPSVIAGVSRENSELQRLPDAFDAAGIGKQSVVNPVQAAQSVQIMPAAGAVLGSSTATIDSSLSAISQSYGDTIATPIQDSNWGERIGERVLMMAGKQLGSAEIRLTPAELGPLRIQLSVDEGTTNVSFQAQHALTRDALEQAMPRLRELLADAGLALGQTSVSDEGVSAGDRDQQSAAQQGTSPGDGDNKELAADELALRQKIVTSNALVDTFA